MPSTTSLRFPSAFRGATALACAVAMVATGCSSDEAEAATPKSVVEAYAEGVHASYEKSLASARTMDTAIDAFLTTPSEATFTAAKTAWLAARNDYGQTEAFRFYGGPIDNEEFGKEGQINAWPLDEQYIDSVEGAPNAGVINNPAQYPVIDAEVIAELNEKDGEANISTGWHAIEFLLWGQDKSETGPGVRPFTDYTTATNFERRKTYLNTATNLLIGDLAELVTAWEPGVDNYRAKFVGGDPNEALRQMITGIGEMSRGELSGERISVAFLDRSQEDEHSCFSDNTHNDIIANATGIQVVVEGTYVSGKNVPGFADLVETKDAALAQRLRDEVAASVASTKAIPAPFDQHLRQGVPDDSPGRTAISTVMTNLDKQTDTIVAAAQALGITIQVS